MLYLIFCMLVVSAVCVAVGHFDMGALIDIALVLFPIAVVILAIRFFKRNPSDFPK